MSGAKMQWQTIETAPKDGSDFAVYNPSFGGMTSLMWWCVVGQCFDCHSGELMKYGGPTHWMPLPAPPT